MKEELKRKRKRAMEKVGIVLDEYKKGDLHSGKSDKIVTSRKQALAIALSESRKVK